MWHWDYLINGATLNTLQRKLFGLPQYFSVSRLDEAAERVRWALSSMHWNATIHTRRMWSKSLGTTFELKADLDAIGKLDVRLYVRWVSCGEKNVLVLLIETGNDANFRG